MAEGFLRSFDPDLQVFSAGTNPAEHVNSSAIKVMGEIGIDISKQLTKNVDTFINQSFDYVITVCDNAKETCPVFHGRVGQRIHFSFADPAAVRGTAEEILSAFRRTRDEIRRRLSEFYSEIC